MAANHRDEKNQQQRERWNDEVDADLAERFHDRLQIHLATLIMIRIVIVIERRDRVRVALGLVRSTGNVHVNACHTVKGEGQTDRGDEERTKHSRR